MLNHVRLTKVMVVLMVAMTAGALILLTLQGRPIKPMPFSLSRQVRLTAIDDALGTEAGIELGRWKRIHVAYELNNGRLSASRPMTPDLAFGYHFVIADAATGCDGRIFTSSRWVRQLTCLPTRSVEDSRTIGICILVEPGQTQGSARQERQRHALIANLIEHCQIKPRVLWKNP